jgi:hypothetical protein
LRPIAHTLNSEIRALVCESLRQCDSGVQAQSWLAERQFLSKLEELAAANFDSLSQLESSQKVVGAILNQPELIHYALLAQASSEATTQLVRAVESPVACSYFPISGIWRSYASAIVSFVRKQPVTVAIPRPKGYEKFYVPYLAFMSAATREEREAALKEIEASFHQRNKDRRCKDWLGLDGDGETPVRWDFRSFTLAMVV